MLNVIFTVTTKNTVIEYIEKENILLPKKKKKSAKHRKTVIWEMRDATHKMLQKNSKITVSNALPVSNHSKCKRVKLLTNC